MFYAKKRVWPILLWMALFSGCIFAVRGDHPQPPEQPDTGPGGKSYAHQTVTFWVQGERLDQYWVFEPAEPRPETAPLVIFHHGWGATDPTIYGAWIEHIVRRGNIVLFPRYQEGWLTPPATITDNAVAAVHEALEEWKTEGHVQPELDKVAIVGHSAGGILSANMAARAEEAGIPVPKALLCVQPGKSWGKVSHITFPLEALDRIPPATLLLTVAGDRDSITSDIDARKIFEQTTAIPLRNKNMVYVLSDDHGVPSLDATHLFPVAFSDEMSWADLQQERLARSTIRRRWQGRLHGHSVNALDFYGLWKLFDALCDAAFYGTNRCYALGNTPEQRFMGKWSDGTPVKELVVMDTLEEK